MIIFYVIQILCLIAIVFELFSIYGFLCGCTKVRCSVVSSSKVLKRRDGFLVDEYWKTAVTSECRGKPVNAVLRTSTYCPAGQQIECYYHLKKNIIFRKRDLRKNLHSSSLAVLSVSILFLVLNSVFSLASIGRMLVKNIVTVTSWALTIIFITLGIILIAYAVIAAEKKRDKDVITVNASISDVIRKSSKHNENEQFSYYPIYLYKLNGVEHRVHSKIKHSSPPAVGSSTTVLVNKTKGSLVEYNDVAKSFFEGLCFIAVGLCFIAVQWFLLIPE